MSLQSTLQQLTPVREYIPNKVNRKRWTSALVDLPHHGGEHLEHFLDEYERGMDIGLPSTAPPARSKTNPPMDLVSKCKMAETIIKWHKKGYMMGPFAPDDPSVRQCRINPVFCVPKPGGAVRPVINYSKEMDGDSLNGLLEPDLCTVEYIQLKEIVYTISKVGRGAMMWAKDLEDGYFNIKIKPEQTSSIAFIFAGLVFVPMVLAFGISSAPLIFTVFMWYAVSAIRFADLDLMWLKVPKSEFERGYFQQEADVFEVAEDRAVFIPLIMYYLDDIFGVQTPDKVWQQYKMAGDRLNYLGLSAKESKDRPPSTTQKILGLEYDSVRWEIRIPEDKVTRYVAFANSLISKSQVTKKELFSLTGKTRHASVQCKALSSFARGVEIHGHQLRGWHWHINMSNRLKRDIMLIIQGLEHNRNHGKSFDFILKPRDCFDYVAYTDASSTIGIGGFINIPDAPYFQVRWNEIEHLHHTDINWMELVAICVLIECNLDRFKGKCIHIWCDNNPVVWMLIKWRAPLDRKDLQHVLRRIARLCILHNIVPWWDHISGHKNITADRLSRFVSEPFEFAAVTPSKNPIKSARQCLQSCTDLCS